MFVSTTYSQQTKPTILKSTITTVGSASVFTVTNSKKSYSIQQSIGQSSIIGTKNADKTNIQQGQFLTETTTGMLGRYL